jgi:hypothetical protein
MELLAEGGGEEAFRVNLTAHEIALSALLHS